MKRIFDASCIDCLRRYSSDGASSGLSTTIASAASSPIFVPPNETTSAPSTHLAAASTPSDAAAFASREPSMWNSIPCACA